MPELPEVEIARRHLDRWVGGKTLLRVEAARTRVLGAAGVRGLAKPLEKATYRGSERRGKNVVARLTRGKEEIGLRLHLGMTGKLLLRTERDPAPRFTRASLHFSGGVVVHFVDMRMFGQLEAGPWEKLQAEAFEGLGRDPLVDGLDGKQLAERLASTRIPIKVALMDQARIAGIGNIHASEALWRAKISPLVRANSLSASRYATLAKGIAATIEFGLKSVEAREDVVYVEEPGSTNPFQVYDRAGESCRRCRKPIQRKVQGGRSTFYCRNCQK